jgi:autotransporter-associated beta strand protein
MTQAHTTSRRTSILLAALSCCAVASATEASFQHYRFTPIKLRNDTTANSIQLAEFQFLHLGSPVSFAGATTTNTGGATPAAEGPVNLIDGVNTTKWLDFFRSSVTFTFPAATTIDGYRFTTANDGTERDPLRWLIEGSNDEVTWTLLDHRDSDFATPTARATSSGDIPLPASPAPYAKNWTGSIGANWDTVNANWNNGSDLAWTNASTDLARFGSGTPTAITLSEAISARVLEFNAPGYLIQGNTLTLTNVTRLRGTGDAEISSVVAGTVGAIKTGSNAITLSGNNTFTGPLQVRGGSLTLTGTNAFAGTTTVTSGGTLNFGGASNKAIGLLEVGTAQGKGVMNISGTSTLLFNGTPVVGTGLVTPGSGAIRQSGGTATYSISGQYFTLANTAGSYGSYELSAGTMSTPTDSGIRVSWNGPAVLTQSGGSLTSGRWFAIGGTNSKGIATFTGGTATTIPAYRLIAGDQAGSNGTINIGTAAGGTAVVSTVRTATGANDGSLSLANANASTGTLNLNSGTLKLHGRIFRSTTATGNTALLNLNGGTLLAGADNVELVNGSLSGVRMFRGGLTIDTDGKAATFAAPIDGQGENGIYFPGNSLAVPAADQGSGYIGAPIVTVSTDGAGSGAMAIANVTDGAVTSVTLTCPGTGYQTGDVLFFLFDAGGYTEPAMMLEHTLTAGELASNGTGGVTKTGAGTLTLTQPSTFTGPLNVNTGTLVVNNTLAQTTTTVAAGATLGGSFVTAGPVTVNGTLAPGVTVGTASGSSSLTLAAGSTFAAQIADWNGAAGTGYDTADFASVNITATNGSKLTVQVDATGLLNFTESARDFVIASADAAPTGLTASNWQVNVTGFTGSGTWSLVVEGSNLVLSYEPGASGYGTWIAGFPGLSDSSVNGDPDKDGITNLVEYVLNGQPGTSSTQILPQAITGGGNLSFSFVRRAESKGDTIQIFQHGPDLVSWTDVAIPATSGGNVTITADSPSAGLETVVVTIPTGTSTTLFARLKVTQP